MSLLKIILSDNDRKGLFQIFSDFLKLSLHKKENKNAIDLYASNLLYKKHSGHIENYASDRVLWRVRAVYQKKYEDDTLLLNNKANFQKFLEKNKIPTTNLIGEIINKNLDVINEEKFSLNSVEDFKKHISLILKNRASVFIKPTEGTMGDNICKIDKSSLEQIAKLNLDTDYIIEETLIQDDKLSAINPNCINTIRIITYKVDKEVYFLSGILRMGVGNIVIDNTSKGGLFIKYDLNTNTLGDVAYNHFRFGGKSFYKHPNTGFVFKGQQLNPNQNIEIMEMLKRAAILFNSPLIGWDIACTDKGPKIIEANARPAFNAMQIVEKGLLPNPVFKQILDNI